MSRFVRGGPARPLYRLFARLGGAAAVVALAAAIAVAGVAIAGLENPASAQVSRQHGDPGAESFVQTQASRALAILDDGSMGVAAKKKAFYGFINQVADVPRITGFVLGRYRRVVTPAQYAAFSDAFRDYADSVYETRLSDYHGEKLQVTGSLVRQPGDAVVTSEVTGGQFRARPAQVLWRVLRDAQGNWRVVDVQAQGVWLAVVEQQDFTSTLANHNGDINVLINQLRTDANRGTTARAGA